MTGERFSNLDFGILEFGLDASGRLATGPALTEVIEAAMIADALGYKRFWLGEHQTAGAAFGGSPEVLLPVIAGATQSIRVGLGALLLGYYSPLKVANQFRLLEALFPGRIDLGLGRAPADNPASHRALLDGRTDYRGFPQDLYAKKCIDVVAFLRRTVAADHPDRDAALIPPIPNACEVWMCGAQSATHWAARLSVGLSVTLFHGVDAASVENGAIAQYRAHFEPSASMPAARAMIAIAGACVEDTRDAERVRRAWLERAGPAYRPSIVGTPAEWSEKLGELVTRHAPDDVMILDICEGAQERKRSLSLLAEVFGLPRRAT
jgi:luciferase family oxidoreductase group 1